LNPLVHPATYAGIRISFPSPSNGRDSLAPLRRFPYKLCHSWKLLSISLMEAVNRPIFCGISILRLCKTPLQRFNSHFHHVTRECHSCIPLRHRTPLLSLFPCVRPTPPNHALEITIFHPVLEMIWCYPFLPMPNLHLRSTLS